MPQPDNPKLFEAIENQAKAKYPKRRGQGTSPQANKMIHEKYLAAGGGYVRSKKEIDPKKRDFKKEAEDKAKEKEKRKKREMKKRNFVV
jgi:hypothetical protein